MSKISIPEEKNKTRKWILSIFFFAVFFGVFYLFVKILWPFITPIILSSLLALLFYPIYQWLVKILKGRERVAAVLMCVLVVLLVVIPFAGFLGLLSKEAYEFYQDTQDKVTTGYYQQLIEENSWVYNNTQTQLERIGVSISLEDQRENLINAAKSTSSFFYSRAGALVQNIFQAFFYFFSILFILYYLFKDRKKISKTLLDLSPLPDDLEVKLMHRIAEVGKAVIFGNMITAAVQGVLGGVGFLIFGLGNGIFWGTVIGVASLIPSLGTFIVAIPASAILFIQGKWVLGILFLLYFGLIVGSIDNILKPKLIESKIKMHPLLVFVGVLGGLLVFGPLGIIYGPLIVTIFVAFVEMYRDHFREKAFE